MISRLTKKPKRTQMPLHHEAIMRANRPDLSIAGVFMEVSEQVVAPHPGHRQTSSGSGDRRLRILAFVVIVFGNLATTYTNRERQRMFLLVHADGSHGSSMVDLRSRPRWQRGARGSIGLCIARGLCQSPVTQSSQDRLAKRCAYGADHGCFRPHRPAHRRIAGK